MYNKSQFGQDQQVINFFSNKKNGYFIEIGAYDGVNMSNTYLLEYAYNWKGICVEANPLFYNKLVENRPNCINLDCAVFNEDDKTMDFINDDTGGCSGFVNTNSHTHILHKQIIKVNTKKLNTILDTNNAPKFIEFLSIDTEGSEYDILSAFDFSKYTFGYICVEHNHIEKNRTKIRNLLVNNGYVYFRNNHVDDDYIHSSLI
jgi:FkbM family methyltransferase